MAFHPTPLIGKQPADTYIWTFTGTSPAFIRKEGQLYEGGPIWPHRTNQPRISSLALRFDGASIGQVMRQLQSGR
jgi:hypothetical protein